MTSLFLVAAVIATVVLFYAAYLILCSAGPFHFNKTIWSVDGSVRYLFRDLKKLGWKVSPSFERYEMVHPSYKYLAVLAEPTFDYNIRNYDFVVRIYDKDMNIVSELTPGVNVSQITDLH